MKLYGEKTRDLLIEILPYLSTIVGRDLMACVTDTEKFIAYVKGKNIDVGAEEGKPVPKEDPLYKAMQQKEILIDNVPKEAYGYPFKAVMNPIFDDRGIEVIGAIGLGLSMENEAKVTSAAQNLADSFEQITASAQEIGSSANEVSAEQQSLDESIKNVTDKILEINKVLKSLHKLAKDSKMLGLNASIEAARAGENGKGFSVVAEEIQKFSSNTIELSQQIEKMTEAVESEVDKVKGRSEKTSSYVHEQASAVQEITASIEEINSISQELEQLARNL